MSGPESNHQPPNLSPILIAGAVALCVIQVLVLVPTHDTAWLIEPPARMLQGGKYYTDFYELNPPLYPILLFPVDLVSRATGITPYPIFIVYVSALIYYVSSLAPGSTPQARMLLALCMQACL